MNHTWTSFTIKTDDEIVHEDSHVTHAEVSGTVNHNAEQLTITAALPYFAQMELVTLSALRKAIHANVDAVLDQLEGQLK